MQDGIGIGLTNVPDTSGQLVPRQMVLGQPTAQAASQILYLVIMDHLKLLGEEQPLDKVHC